MQSPPKPQPNHAICLRLEVKLETRAAFPFRLLFRQQPRSFPLPGPYSQDLGAPTPAAAAPPSPLLFLSPALPTPPPDTPGEPVPASLLTVAARRQRPGPGARQQQQQREQPEPGGGAAPRGAQGTWNRHRVRV